MAPSTESAPISGVRGIDVLARFEDICNITAAFFVNSRTRAYIAARHREGYRVPMSGDDFAQDVLLTIERRNGQGSAFDSGRASFSKYIWQVCRTVLTHTCDKQDRVDTLASVEAADPCDGHGSILDDATESAFAEPRWEGEDAVISEIDRRRISDLWPGILRAIRMMPIEDLLAIHGGGGARASAPRRAASKARRARGARVEGPEGARVEGLGELIAAVGGRSAAGKICGCSIGTIGNWLRGATQPTPADVDALRAARSEREHLSRPAAIEHPVSVVNE